MNYTQSNGFATDAGTGRRLHQDTAPVPTLLSAKDVNSVVWSLMRLLADAGVSAADFDPAVPATYNRVSLAVQALSSGLSVANFTGTNQSLSGNGWQKLPGGLVLQWAAAAFADVVSGIPGTTGVITLPTTFPTACLQCFLTVGVSAGAASNMTASVTATTTSQVSYQVEEWSNANNPGTLSVLAIGY